MDCAWNYSHKILVLVDVLDVGVLEALPTSSLIEDILSIFPEHRVGLSGAGLSISEYREVIPPQHALDIRIDNIVEIHLGGVLTECPIEFRL